MNDLIFTYLLSNYCLSQKFTKLFRIIQSLTVPIYSANFHAALTTQS